MIIDVQFSPAHNSWPVLRAATTAADAAGFGAVWVFDHLAGQALRGPQMIEAFTLLGALAATTERIALGTLVLNVTHREPGVVAVAAASVEAIAGRPVLLGLGAGSAPGSRWATEVEAIGQRIERTQVARHARVEHTLDVLDAIWAPDRAAELATYPLPRWRPPVILGVNSTALARLAGRRADGVNVAWHDPHRARWIDAARAARAGRGVAPAGSGFLTTAWARWDDALLDPDHPQRRAMASVALDRLVLSAPAAVDPDRIAALVADPG